MQIPKKSTLLATAAVVVGLGVASAGVIHAQSPTSPTNPMSNLINAIATKFNLNPTDVQQVFDDQHAQMEVQHQQAMKDHLAQLVMDGKLTQEQADKITSKLQELESQHEANKTAFQGKTKEEVRTLMEQERTQLEQWAKDNNIPMEYLHFGFGKGHGPGMHGFGMRGGTAQ